MEAGIVSRAELLRPWADAPCPFCEGEGCVKCGPGGRDERFDALRDTECHDHDPRDPGGYCLQTDVGSVLRAAAACGFGIRTLVWENGDITVQVTRQETDVVVAALTVPQDAETIDDAAAAAFAAAVQERAS